MSVHHYHKHTSGAPAFIVALGITAAYALVELVGGWWSGSLALLGDSGHMFSDAFALGIAAVAAKLSQRPTSQRHSYGWARAEVIGALLNGVLMLAIILMLVVEAVGRLQAPRPVAASAMMLIALVGIAVNAGVAWIISRGTHTLNTRGALLHVLGDLLSSFAAVVAGAVILTTGWLPIDPILSLVIAGLILISALRLMKEALHVLMEGVPAAIELAEVGRALVELPGVVSVHDLHVWSITPEQVALSAHVELEDLQHWPAILASASALLRARYGIGHVTLQPETPRGPDERDTSVVRLWPRLSRPRR